MPYVSDRQRRWAHTDTAKAKGFPTREFDEASRGMDLPETASKSTGKKKFSGRAYTKGRGFSKGR